MDKLQVGFFFITGFFISRLIIKAEIPQLFVKYLLDNKHTSLTKIVLYLVLLSSLFSFFIPNVITVLTLLPVITTIITAFESQGVKEKSLATVLTLAVMYGANIGGMGSITATPANGILISFLGLNQIPNSDSISFASWLVWGIPLVFVFATIAWLVLTLVFNTWKTSENHSEVKLSISSEEKSHVKLTLLLTGIYFISSILFSVWMLNSLDNKFLVQLIFIITGIFTLLFVVYMFAVPVKCKLKNNKKPLLKLKDCYSNLPLKGFLFVGISIAVATVLYLFELQQPFAEFVKTIIPDGLSPYLILFILALLTSFSTELLSNTAIQISLFVIIPSLAVLIGFSALEALLVVTLSSTCAFMSPIATGVNGLAFGGVKHVSLKMMLISGLIINILGAVLISFWIRFLVGEMML